MLVAAASAVLALATADRAAAAGVLRAARCDHCHDSAVSAGNAAALAVYDLHLPEWPSTMSDEQLPKMMGRLRNAPPKDREVVRKFIAAELASRHAPRR